MRIRKPTPVDAGVDTPEDPLVMLARLVEAGDGLLPADLLEAARALLDRAGQRRLIAPGISVVALLGATGSGKSSLFNAICGVDAAPTAVTRPTTTQPLAALPASPAPEADGAAGRLLDWLAVDARVRLPESPSWGPASVGVGENTILLDLPDIDSDVRQHRVIAERLAGLVDVLVWVLDPEKYADAVIHHEFIAPMAAHASVSVVALNQVDRLNEAERTAATHDLARLLAREGLEGVDVIEVSARNGQGVQELRARIREVAAAEDVSRARLAADARALAVRIHNWLEPDSTAAAGSSGAGEREALVALREAACRAVGTDRVADAVCDSMRLAAAARVGWLPARWLARLRRDPLRALHLGDDVHARRTSSGSAAPPVPRTSLPAPDAAADAALRATAQGYMAAMTGRLPTTAQEQVCERLSPRAEQLYDRLDAAVGRTDLEQNTRPRWWACANALQVLLALTALVGGLWLLILRIMNRYLLLAADPPRWGHLPWPTVLLLGGLLLGLVLGLIGTALARVGAARRRGRVNGRLRQAVAEVLATTLVEPLDVELARIGEVRALLDVLCSTPGRRDSGSGPDIAVGRR
ncbi:GTPase [Actinomyces succiniciruminis]|uniref:50S ribosome-binding GTPase n=1 Tax=Actinomyces succiniciruminis TaxID=1522002 RepID=A0A1L7RRS4_9ACTO|nr:GTPase [Actinomyces succiniciruminis]CED92278.1 50S ribosome-binding GTPase [Actinomyces succiniciruminis]